MVAQSNSHSPDGEGVSKVRGGEDRSMRCQRIESIWEREVVELVLWNRCYLWLGQILVWKHGWTPVDECPLQDLKIN